MTSNVVQQEVVGIIPARYASTRFPGKMLAPIGNKPLIQHTYENARRSDLFDSLIVATDDKRIFDHVQSFGGDVVMTSLSCPNGTERLVEVMKKTPKLHTADIIVNIQGDEPCVDPEITHTIIEALRHAPDAVMSTPIIRLKDPVEAQHPSIVKCVIDNQGYALYFSRSLIPAGHNLAWQPNTTYYRHIGIYAYRPDFLLKYADLPKTPLQIAEDLEQLKVLEHGFRIKTAIVNSISIGVDIPDDIKKVEQWLCKQNTFL